MRILHVVGARPNFMKAAPVMEALAAKRDVRQTLVHTGQHYDTNMSDIFFRQLGLPEPDVNLGVGSGSQTEQTANTMLRFEPVIEKDAPDWLVVYGDVNSTVASALVAAKLGVRVAHVEAGLRSRDRGMPEELNRLLTDQLADLLLTPSRDGDENLEREGIPAERVRFVGNVMIDTLIRLLPKATRPEIPGLRDRYLLVTLHRPSNVDDPDMLRRILDCLSRTVAEEDAQVVFPMHPRTRHRLDEFGIPVPSGDRFLITEPVGYLEFLALQRDAAVVVTDSGGIQEETTYLRVPCLTVRENTERPVTVTEGTNRLVGHDMDLLRSEVHAVLNGERRASRIPELWDGHAGERIADVLGEGL